MGYISIYNEGNGWCRLDVDTTTIKTKHRSTKDFDELVDVLFKYLDSEGCRRCKYKLNVSPYVEITKSQRSILERITKMQNKFADISKIIGD